MAIKRIGPNRYQIKLSIRVPGKDHPVSRQEQFSGTKIEAEARRIELINETRRKHSANRSFTYRQQISTFGELSSLFLEMGGRRGKSLSRSHIRMIHSLSKDFRNTPLGEFADRFDLYLKELKRLPTRNNGKKRSEASLNRLKAIARAIFNLAVDLEYIEKNPITKARFPITRERARDRYLTNDERLRLLNALQEYRPHILPIIRYMMLVPCRKMELVTAKKEQYNPFTGTIYIPDSKSDTPIYKPVPEEMKAYFNSIPPECKWLFYRQDKNGYHPLGDFKKAWAFCLKKASLQNVRIHDLRHISATDLYEAGNPERVIMDIAGWTTPMLSTYRHKDSFKSAQAIVFNPQSPDKGSQSAAV
ncbi:MAG: tyrosine-type recombinase/integrase [Chitinispirillaceae bacterium]